MSTVEARKRILYGRPVGEMSDDAFAHHLQEKARHFSKLGSANPRFEHAARVSSRQAESYRNDLEAVRHAERLEHDPIYRRRHNMYPGHR